jgi:hypothetical protein
MVSVYLDLGLVFEVIYFHVYLALFHGGAQKWVRFGCSVVLFVVVVAVATFRILCRVEAASCVQPCPFVISSNSGKSLVTVRPSHNAICLFLIAATHVGLAGNPTTA